jgi:hypothetical protein
MITNESTPAEGISLAGYLIPLIIALMFLGWGLFIFYAVGDKGSAFWFYGGIPDVPGQSEYSTSAAKQFYFNATSPERQGRVERQHVMGEESSSHAKPGEPSQ